LYWSKRLLTEVDKERARVAGKVTQYWLVRALMVLAVVAWASKINAVLTGLFGYLHGHL
jgi:hypothetical protein